MQQLYIEEENGDAQMYVFVLKRNLFVIAKTEVKQVNRNASLKKLVDILVNTTK